MSRPRPKVGIVGAGNVGATAAFEIAERELADVVLIDVAEGIPQGKGLDMLQSGPVVGFDSLLAGSNDYAALQGADVVVITAGLARKPGMSRLDLLEKNRDIVAGVARKLREYAPNCVIISVTNPLDVMAYVAMKESGFPPERVLGMAGVLDSARFATFIALEVGCSVKDVSAMVLGGHGDQMVPLPRFTTISGIPITELIPAERIESLAERTRKGGAEIVEFLKTGSAYYAPGTSVAVMVESILKDQRRLLPTAAYLTGQYGLNDLFIGVPCLLGAGGLKKIYELRLTDAELKALHHSADILRTTMKEAKLI
jgi:malate dehydrogenase